MPSNPVPSRQMKTRAGNKTSHPGNIVKPPKRRTTTEVEEERATKAQAKEDRELAKKRGLERAAQFECEDRIREDELDVTPPPTPALPRTSSLPPDDSDVEMTAAGDAHFEQPIVNDTIILDDSDVEIDSPCLVKGAGANSTAKGIATDSKKAKAAARKKTTEGAEVRPESEPPKDPKPKRTLREEVDHTEECEEDREKKIGALVKLM